MKYKKILFWMFLFSICFLMSNNNSFAQRSYTFATYQVSFPLGDTKDYTNATSFRGFGLGFRYTVQKSTTVGLDLGWTVFNERISETVQLEGENPGAVTGTQDRFLNTFPIMANVHYYFGERRGIRPYIGLNAGGYYMVQRFDIGIVSLQEDRWEWGIAPEVGVIFPIERDFAIIVNGKYNYAFTGKSPLGTDIKHSYVGLNVGFVWQQ